MISQTRKSILLIFAGLSAWFVGAGVVLAGEPALMRRGISREQPTIRAQVGSPFAAQTEEKSSFSDSVKNGFGKMTGVFSSKKKSGDTPPEVKDNLSLSNRAEPSPKLHTSLARVFESQGRVKDAEVEFRRAIDVEPNSRLALLEYARFLDRQEQYDLAVKLYRHTEKLHRKDPAVQNDLGLCYARHDRNELAIAAFEKAVELAPGSVLYRNNLAMVLVDVGRHDEALKHLLAVNGTAVAEYNMGYLLQKAGKTELAQEHFRAAARYNPHMKQAQWWIASAQLDQPMPGDPQRAVAGPVGPPPQRVQIPPRSPEQTAMRPQTRTTPKPMVWAQSGDTTRPPATARAPARVERFPALRQPGTVVTSQGSAYRAAAETTERLPSPQSGGTVPLEPLPPTRR